MKKLVVAAAALSFTVASHAVLISQSAEGYVGWTDSDFQTFTDTGWNSGWNGTYNVDDTYLTPVFQSFTAEHTGTIGSLHLMCARDYGGENILTVYELFDGDGSTPNAMPATWDTADPDWMTPIDSYAFTLIPAGGSWSKDFMLTVEMEAAEQFSITTGHTYAVGLSSPGDASPFWWSTTTLSDYTGGGSGVAGPAAIDTGLGYTVIPEPATIGLVGMFGLALLGVRRNFRV